MNNRKSDNWGRHDHVGGSAKYSEPIIASVCPENHTVEFFAEYWLPDYPNHIIKRGRVNVKVTGNDKTPPVLQWVTVSGDNTILVKLHDGSKIKEVTATLVFWKELNTFFSQNQEFKSKLKRIKLNDEATVGDGVAFDNVFSLKLPEQKFGVYSIEIKATDSFGNTMNEKWEETIVLY
jgi:hypothetical protein